MLECAYALISGVSENFGILFSLYWVPRFDGCFVFVLYSWMLYYGGLCICIGAGVCLYYMKMCICTSVAHLYRYDDCL